MDGRRDTHKLAKARAHSCLESLHKTEWKTRLLLAFCLQAAAPDLLEKRKGNGGTPLLAAAAYGHTEIVKALLAAGASPTARRKDGVAPLHLVRPQL